jgi:hypothetical protein
MDKTKQMYHSKFKWPQHTINTCVFHYLHSYTWHTNESITLSHRSVDKSSNTRCKVLTNQESNSLAPRNRVQKLKIIDFYWFTDDLLKKTAHRFLPIYRRLLRRPTDLSAASAESGQFLLRRGRFSSTPDPSSLPVESGRFLPRRRRFGSAPDPPLRLANLSAASADYQPNLANFCPVAADSVRRPTCHPAQLIYRLPRPITGRFLPRRRRFTLSLTAFSSSLNRTEWERRIHCSLELGWPNTIYMSSGSSGSIFMFLI